MEKDAVSPKKAQTFCAEPMLLDCYTELITYTGYLLKQIRAGAPAFEAVAKTYQTLVERSKQVSTSAGFAEAVWLEGFFPVCAYIDEAILCSDWIERSKWERSQLQRKHFNTTSAGGEFYNRLENMDDSAGNIRQVYEFCMALGFKGRYYQASDIGRLEDIHYTHLKRVTENIDLRYPDALFPDAYEAETAAKQRKRRKWKRISFFSPAAFLLPILLFAVLYFFFDQLLNKTVTQYFGARF